MFNHLIKNKTDTYIITLIKDKIVWPYQLKLIKTP